MHVENKSALQQLRHQLPLTDDQVRKIQTFVDLLESWNRRINLVSKNDVLRIVSKHIKESLEIDRFSLLDGCKTALDLGSGAGFPGIPLAITHPEIQFTVLDSIRKKTLFLHETVETIGLTNVRVLCDRVENQHPSSVRYDVVLSRAVAELDVLWQWSRPLLKVGGRLVAVKGGDLHQEIAHLQNVDSVRVSIHSTEAENRLPADVKKIVVVFA